jgi:regulator of protease activity HflC (stomatin/prohibitin superfamily)
MLPQPKGPGVVFILWPIDRIVRISLRTVVLDVPPQDVITRDNVSVKVNAVVYFRVIDPNRAVVEVENYHYATSQMAQTTLRSVLGQAELDTLLAERESSTTSSRRSSTARPTPGASRCRRSRSSTSICRRRCSARWRGRPRPSARSAPR